MPPRFVLDRAMKINAALTNNQSILFAGQFLELFMCLRCLFIGWLFVNFVLKTQVWFV
jgi:hypothetical protein